MASTSATEDSGAHLPGQDNIESAFEADKLRLLEASLGHLNDIILITDAEPLDEPGPRIVFANQAFFNRTGYSESEVLGRSPRFLQGPRTQRDVLDQVRAGMEARVAVRVELINYTRSGEEFWLEMEVVPVWDSAGKCTHFVAIERDITQRKSAERRQQESEVEALRTLDLLTAVADSIPDAVFVKDLQGRYLLFNEGAAQVVGKSSREVVGHDDGVMFGAEDVKIVRKNDQFVAESGQSFTAEEVLTSAGTTRTFLATKTPYRDRNGKIIGIIEVDPALRPKLLEVKLWWAGCSLG